METSEYRSGLEASIAADLRARGVEFEYEPLGITYIPAERRYTPDFYLHPSGVFVEAKGRFLGADRSKHLMIQAQHQELEIRFVFARPHAPLYKGSKTTNAMWADKHGFKWADRVVPQEWLDE